MGYLRCKQPILNCIRKISFTSLQGEFILSQAEVKQSYDDDDDEIASLILR
jgi:hypothetical protein